MIPRHRHDFHNKLHSGAGWAGLWCNICGLLTWGNDEHHVPDGQIKPTEPDKKNCKHKWLEHHHDFVGKRMKDGSVYPVLCVFGRWCSVCGALENNKPRDFFRSKYTFSNQRVARKQKMNCA